MEPILRSPKRVLVDTAGKWRELVLAERWGRGRGITELAQRWTTTALPEVEALLESHPATSGFVAGEGVVGEREIDLVLEGQAKGGRTLLMVVPIADEPLGITVEEAALRSRKGDRLRRGPPPTEHMARVVFQAETSLIGELRYRLLAPGAALLREAVQRGCPQAVLVLHELRSPLAPQAVLAQQRLDMEAFVRKLSHRETGAVAGCLAGPFPNATSVPLYVGRALFEGGCP